MSRGKVLLMAGVAAFVATMAAGSGGAVFPSTLRWAAWIACPAGTAPKPQSPVREGGFHCVGPGGEVRDRTLPAMGGLWLMYFMATSVVLSLLAARGLVPDPSGMRLTQGEPPRPAPTAVETAAREPMAEDQTIQAIAFVREMTGMGLKEATDWVEAMPHRAPAVEGVTAAPASSPVSFGREERLAELKRMADVGLITAADYEARKAEILAEP
ncbi:MAG TPA: ribosomal protein L7/L12 [Longimicrobium sp.]|nr:ribosomal protein L7/L12 [Longimicrobium sp.]